MWNPTHVQVTVIKAKGLLIKGKGSNNPFVTIAVGKEKFQTSVKEKTADDVITWQEQCELSLTHTDNTTALVLTVLHKSGLVDLFLGTVSIPLSSLAVHERPKCRWYKLEGKPGKEKGKDKARGELEVRIAFTVKASAGSLMDLSSKGKHKSSLGHISSKIGGSLLSLGSSEKRSGIKQLAKNIGKKVSSGIKRDSNGGDGASEKGSLESVNLSVPSFTKNVDPGVISEDEDEFTLDNLSHKSSASSLNASSNLGFENLAGGERMRRSTTDPPTKPPRTVASPPLTPATQVDEWEQKLCGKGDTLKRVGRGSQNPLISSPTSPNEKSPVFPKVEITSNTQNIHSQPTPSPKPAERRFMSSPNLQKQDVEESKESSSFGKKLKHLYRKDKKEERFIVGEECVADGQVGADTTASATIKLDKNLEEEFKGQSREELIMTVAKLRQALDKSERQAREMENYLDGLLLRVMETSPRLLQVPFSSCRTEFNSH